MIVKTDAYEYGKSIGEQVLKYGDFTQEELEDSDKFSEAFYEIVENHKQYLAFSLFAAEINKSKKSETLWDSFDRGVSDCLLVDYNTLIKPIQKRINKEN